MIVCYFGTYREEYSRNKIMMAALRSAGVTVKECHVSLWHGIEDRVNVTIGGWRSPSFWWRLIRAYTRLIMKYFKVRDYDVLMVGYPGQVDVYLARLLANLKKKPLVWDVFMSLYLVAKERNLDQSKHSSIKLIKKIEAGALKKPDLLIQDTAEYVLWFEKEYGISPDRFKLVPTGADDRLFQPLPPSQNEDGLFHVLYYGTYIPNHGIMRIVEAAKLLSEEKQIIFDMIGDGPDRKMAEEFVEANTLQNVRFQDWMDQQSLLHWISDTDVCLGAFGYTPQSLMTVQNKIYECMAMGKAVITGESPTVREAFEHEHEIFICERNAESIARAIRDIKNTPKLLRILAHYGYLHYMQNNCISALGRRLFTYLDQLYYVSAADALNE